MIYIETSIYKKTLAELDSQSFEKVYFDTVKSYIKEEQQEEIISFCKMLAFPFPDNVDKVDEQFKWLILCPPEVIKTSIPQLNENKLLELRDKINFEKSKKRLKKKSKTNDKHIQAFIKLKNHNDVLGKEHPFKHQSLRLNNILVRLLGVTVCPYCNRDFINPRGTYLGNDMDHFYDKDHYPLFAMSLYNFVPSCKVCNNVKNNSAAFRVHPFVKDDFTPENELRFQYQLKQLDDVAVEIRGDRHRLRELESIKLSEAYAVHSLDVKNMLDREVRYSDSYREELRNLFQQEGDFSWILTDDEIDRMIYGDSIFEEDIKNIPLGKFRKDIYEEIKRLR